MDGGLRFESIAPESVTLTTAEAESLVRLYEERERNVTSRLDEGQVSLGDLAELLHCDPQYLRALLVDLRSGVSVQKVTPKATKIKRKKRWAIPALLVAIAAYLCFVTVAAARRPRFAIYNDFNVVRDRERAAALLPQDVTLVLDLGPNRTRRLEGLAPQISRDLTSMTPGRRQLLIDQIATAFADSIGSINIESLPHIDGRSVVPVALRVMSRRFAFDVPIPVESSHPTPPTLRDKLLKQNFSQQLIKHWKELRNSGDPSL